LIHKIWMLPLCLLLDNFFTFGTCIWGTGHFEPLDMETVDGWGTP
jgi:hypothetical protein